jgi:Zn ribbon nucleic-acid-binding protein
MWWFKTCPRCKGDLTRTDEEGQVLVHCLQCGYELTPRQVVELLRAGHVPIAAPRPVAPEPVETRRAA